MIFKHFSLNSPAGILPFYFPPFIKLVTHVEVARKLEALEKKYDRQFRVVFDGIRDLMAEPETPKRKALVTPFSQACFLFCSLQSRYR